jgi:3-methyladenine DNA glycosylase AlkD
VRGTNKIRDQQTAKIAPQRLAQQTLQRLRAAGNERAAAQSSVYFKAHEQVVFFGVATPELRRIERELYQQVKGQWTFQDALAFCELLIVDKRQEAKTAGLLLLARYHKTFDRELLARFEAWLGNDCCNNWALTDALGTFVIALYLRRFPETLPQIKSWTRAENLWLRRASAVSLVPLARKGEQLDDVYAIAERLFKYPEDLIHKATGWLLREAGKTDQVRLKNFLLQHGAYIPRTALRYALERFPEAERKQLLSLTR